MMRSVNKNQGSILIIVLWLIMLGLILVTAMAANVRLSASTVIHQQEALQDWSKILDALNKAHMELLIEKMPNIKVDKTSLYNRADKKNRFDGRALTLSYPASEDMVVRIYDLSGKINIARLKQEQLEGLLAQQLGENDQQITELIDAWYDWLDADDLKRLNGAEKGYYQQEKLDYVPRNGNFASVDEILQIKGFNEIFSGIDLDAVFTLSGNYSGKINPNFVSREILMMLPGMDEELADKLIKARKNQYFKKMDDVNVYLTPITIAKLNGWFDFKNSEDYAIVVYPKSFEDEEKTSQTIYAYMEEVRVTSASKKPQVLRVMPYAKVNIE